MEGYVELLNATQTKKAVEERFTTLLGVVTKIVTLEGSVCVRTYTKLLFIMPRL